MAASADEVQSSPISPELALVDPALAAWAREQLPEHPWHATALLRPEPPESAGEESEAAVVAPIAAPARSPVRRRTVLIGALTFVLGAAVGGYLGDRRAQSPAAVFEAQVTAALSAPTGGGGQSSSVRQAPLRPPELGSGTASRPTTAAKPAKKPLHWATNVLGVTAQVGRTAVTLVWENPVGSDHVVVLRALRDKGRGVAVFHGRATSYRDASTRPCTDYTYTIVNHDRAGHRSTGVPTSVVTGC